MLLCDFMIISPRYNSAYSETIINLKCTMFYKKLRIEKMIIVKRALVAKDVWKWLISDNDAVQDLHYSWVLAT